MREHYSPFPFPTLPSPPFLCPPAAKRLPENQLRSLGSSVISPSGRIRILLYFEFENRTQLAATFFTNALKTAVSARSVGTALKIYTNKNSGVLEFPGGGISPGCMSRRNTARQSPATVFISPPMLRGLDNTLVGMRASQGGLVCYRMSADGRCAPGQYSTRRQCLESQLVPGEDRDQRSPEGRHLRLLVFLLA